MKPAAEFLSEPKKICAWCQTVLRDGPEPASHGICHACRMLHWPMSIRPALMAPATTRWECHKCDQVMRDDDGVAEGCRLAKCDRTDRRDPWFLVTIYNRILRREKH